MKMMNKFCALMLSVALCAGMAAPAFAYGGEPVEEVEQPVLTSILSSSILQKNPIRVSLSVSVTSCSPPAIPKRPADIVDEDKRTRYTEDGSGIRSNP